jgi:hypothetical protein
VVFSWDRPKDYRIPLSAGLLLFLAAATWDSEIGLIRCLLAILMVVGAGLIGWSLQLRNRNERTMDERFFLNRLKASRAALVVGLILILGLMVYGWALRSEIRWDLFAVIIAIAVAKGIAILYYQRVG